LPAKISFHFVLTRTRKNASQKIGLTGKETKKYIFCQHRVVAILRLNIPTGNISKWF